jgi:predicted alpha/beta-fold hydrolase
MDSLTFPAFRPPRWLRGGHVQTVAGFFLSGPEEPYTATRRVLTLSDGDRVVLHDDRPEGWRPGGPAALLLHGLCGDYRSSYVARAAAKLNRRGVRTFRMDHRCCGAAWGLAARPYHAGSSDDAAAALGLIARLCPGSPACLVGYSMGGNIALKLAGEAPDALPENLRSVLAVSPPIDLAEAAAALRRPLNRLYDRYFMRSIRRMVAPLRPRYGRRQPVPFNFRTLHEFNETFLSRVWGFGSAARYYAVCSAAQFLPAIRVPTLVITARDDPIVPVAAFERARFSPCTRGLITEHGGHLGFVGRTGPADPDRRWMDWRVVDWVSASLAGLCGRPEGRGGNRHVWAGRLRLYRD